MRLASQRLGLVDANLTGLGGLAYGQLNSEDAVR
jgi:hypothetical protein